MTHHRRGLRRLLSDDDLLAAIEEDHEKAALEPRQHAMLRYAEKLTRTPKERLGYGPKAEADIKKQAFFKSINWAKLDQLQIKRER